MRKFLAALLCLHAGWAAAVSLDANSRFPAPYYPYADQVLMGGLSGTTNVLDLGRQRHCLTFDGGTYVDHGLATQHGGTNMTISGWIYPKTITYLGGILGKYTTAGNQRSWILSFHDGLERLRFDTTHDGSTQVTSYSSNSSVPLDTWSYIVVTKTDDAVTFTVNGVDVTGSQATHTYPHEGTGKITVGAWNEGTASLFEGSICGLTLSIDGTTILSTPMDEGWGTTIYDVSGNENHGTLTGTQVGAWGSPAPTAVASAASAEYQSSACLTFDGTTYVDHGLATQHGGTNMVISGWIYPTAGMANEDGNILSKFSGAGNRSWRLVFDPDPDRLRFVTSSDGTAQDSSYSGSSSVPSNTWSYFVVTKTGTNVTFDVNGVDVTGSQASHTVPFESVADIIGGGRNGGATGPFIGSICGLSLEIDGTTILTTPLAEGAGAVAYDVSGSGNDGTIVNGDWDTTQNVYHRNIDKGFSPIGTFDGSDDYVDFGLATQHGGTNMVISGWIYPETGTGSSAIIGKYLDVGDQRSWLLYYNETFQLLVFATSALGDGTLVTTQTTGVVPVDTWSYFTMTKIGADVTFTVNGVDVTSTAGTHTVPAEKSADILVGARSAGADYEFKGSIADLSLSIDGTTIFTTPLTDGSGTTIADTSGNGNNGTLTGATSEEFWLTRVPALDAETVTAAGFAISNEGDQFHNGAESTFVQTDTTITNLALWSGSVTYSNLLEYAADSNGVDGIYVDAGDDGIVRRATTYDPTWFAGLSEFTKSTLYAIYDNDELFVHDADGRVIVDEDGYLIFPEE